MFKRRRVLQTGAVALAALAGCAGFAPGATDRVTRTVDPADATALAAFTPNGRVTVEGADTRTVTVTATKRTTGPGADLDAVDVVTEVAGDTVQVRVEKSAAQWPRVAVDLAIEVPATLVTAHVTTGNGDVTLTNTRGSTVVESGNGAVTMTDYAGYPRAVTGNGDVTLAGGPGAARAWTGNGAIDVEVREVRGVCSLGSGNGDVTARVAADLACELDLDTGNGRVETGTLDVTTATARTGHLSGALNGGGDAVLRATTGNGDVTLRPLDD